MSLTIRKAVFPVAGFGTRFLPATKSVPKEMLPIIDKPLIQYAVEEALEAGMEQMIFVTGHTKKAIEDHFDRNTELENELQRRQKNDLLNTVRDIIPAYASCIYVRQPTMSGLGDAVRCAQPVVGDENFAVLLADDLIDDTPGCLKQMVDAYRETGDSIVAVEEVALDDTEKYGIVCIGGDTESNFPVIRRIVEKPHKSVAPSTLGVVGRYILPPAIFACITVAGVGVKGEIQLTDGIARLLSERPVRAFRLGGIRYDCGSKQGFLAATLAKARNDPELSDLVANIQRR